MRSQSLYSSASTTRAPLLNKRYNCDCEFVFQFVFLICGVWDLGIELGSRFVGFLKSWGIYIYIYILFFCLVAGKVRGNKE